MIPRWCANYIGIPFMPLGRDFSGCDCYGLVRLVLEQEFGLALPDLVTDYRDPFDHSEVGSLVHEELPLLSGERLAAPELGAVAVISVGGQSAHLGLYVGDGMLLHTLDRRGSLLERLSSPFIDRHLEGYYRVRAPRR